MGDLKDLTVEQFTEITASDAPAPGGGSVAALAGGLSAALAEMVANLTIGKAKYAEVEDEMRGLSAQAEELRKTLIDAIQKLRQDEKPAIDKTDDGEIDISMM